MLNKMTAIENLQWPIEIIIVLQLQTSSTSVLVVQSTLKFRLKWPKLQTPSKR